MDESEPLWLACWLDILPSQPLRLRSITLLAYSLAWMGRAMRRGEWNGSSMERKRSARLMARGQGAKLSCPKMRDGNSAMQSKHGCDAQGSENRSDARTARPFRALTCDAMPSRRRIDR